MAPRYRYAVLASADAGTARRKAKTGPLAAEIFVGSQYTSPDREMGGMTMCPSIELIVFDDGRYEVRERTVGSNRAELVVVRGQL